jgi:hypothetical protein
VIEYVLAEKYGMYFIGNSDDKFNALLIQIAYESLGRKDDKPTADMAVFQRDALKLL